MQEILKKREYEFLYHNEHLGKNVILLCVSGSLGYGTGDEQSDVDLRGIALNRKSELIGFDVYEQYEDQQTDTVIYTFNKAIKLFSECNPNMLEMLGLRPEHYLFLHPIGSDLIRRSEMFLTERILRLFLDNSGLTQVLYYFRNISVRHMVLPITKFIAKNFIMRNKNIGSAIFLLIIS